MREIDDLEQLLRRIDGRGYRAYKDIGGTYRFSEGMLAIDYVQGDPFATPSRVRVRLPLEVAGLQADLFSNRTRRAALEDFLARQVRAAIARIGEGRRGSGKSGLIDIDAGAQEVLERTAVRVTEQWVEARLAVGLPAAGRTVLGRHAAAMLCSDLPAIARQALSWSSLPQRECYAFVECVENQEYIRDQLQALGLVAFVANGAILPRVSGVSDRALPVQQAVPFRAPADLQVTVELLHPVGDAAGAVRHLSGLGIPEGITLIVGGGYHGKSTLLQALQRCVYPHVPGDGREYVVTRADAFKIRAEDGRRVEQVDISPFIGRLPYGQETSAFTTENASGSTSQAANIIEALEAGSRLLLLDEDTSATNFMIRDARMQALVHKEHEPITPFLDRVEELYERFGVSSILVMGGSGDYFDAAHTVIMMRGFVPEVVTQAAKQVAREYPARRLVEQPQPFQRVTSRIPLPESFDASHGRREVKIDARAVDLLVFGSATVELRDVEQLVDRSQTRALGYALLLASRRLMDGRASLSQVLAAIEQRLSEEGLEALAPFGNQEQHPGNFARPRRYEIAAAINRLRTVRMRQLR